MYLFSRVFLFLFSICNCAKHINPSIINMNVLVTGAAGFIGSNLCMRLLEELSDTLVVGLDNLNAYYDVNIKRWRLEQLTGFRERFVFIKGSILYDIPSTGLRFFTVYGPAGRPDMAYFGFTDKLLKGEKIKIFNYGSCKRDFTYVDDIVEGVMRVMAKAPERKVGEDGLPVPPYKVYNIGNNHPENLLDFVRILQEELIRAGVLPADYDFEAHKELVPMQPGDVPVTYADTSALERDFGFKPSTPLREGLRKFAGWYKDFYME